METVYDFKPAKHTLNQDFHRANHRNPVLKTNYKFYPYKRQQSE